MKEDMGGIGAVLEEELELARNSAASAQAMILVEGESDRRALEVVATRMGRDLVAEDIPIIAIAGAANIDRFLDLIPPHVGLSGLYDETEHRILREALVRAGIASAGDDLESMGFFVCSRDLEDELIRGVGVEEVLEVFDTEGDLTSWHRFSDQPAQRGRPIGARMHRFLGTRSGRKIEYAGLLAERIDLSDQGSPLLRVLTYSPDGGRAQR